MKNTYLLVVLLLLALPTWSVGQVVPGNQEPEKAGLTKLRATVSFQFGLQAMNPVAVNRYIENYLNYHGFKRASSLLNAFVPFQYKTVSDYTLHGTRFFNFSLTLVPTSRSRIRLMYEHAWSPAKENSMSFNSVDTNFDLYRNSWGVLLNYYFPNKGLDSFLVGAGILSHQMTFEDFHGSSVGLRLEVGYGTCLPIMDFDFVIGLDFASAPAESSSGLSPVSPLKEIDFSGVSFGIRITPYLGKFLN